MERDETIQSVDLVRLVAELQKDPHRLGVLIRFTDEGACVAGTQACAGGGWGACGGARRTAP